MKILMVNHFTQTPYEKGNGRFVSIAEKLSTSNDVKMITTKFSHEYKCNRVISNEQFSSLNYNLILLDEPKYKKNISIKRFVSHYKFGKNLKNYLMENEKPDVIYCSIPSLDAGYRSCRYAKKFNIPIIIDIQDVWPTAFKLILKKNFLSNVVFFPLDIIAKTIYRNASFIFSISETNLIEAKKYNNNHEVVYLGTDTNEISNINSSINKDNEIWVVYLGSLGASYDLINPINAVKILDEENYNLRFIIIGDGRYREEILDFADRQGIKYTYYKTMPYLEMIKILKNCDIALNTFKKGASQSVPNKLCDYTSVGLPIINTLDNEECKNIIENNKIGINAYCEDTLSISEKIKTLIDDENIYQTMSFNSKQFANNYFNKEVTYDKICKKIIFFGNGGRKPSV